MTDPVESRACECAAELLEQAVSLPHDNYPEIAVGLIARALQAHARAVLEGAAGMAVTCHVDAVLPGHSDGVKDAYHAWRQGLRALAARQGDSGA